MPNPDRQAVIDFIGLGGKLGSQLRQEFGDAVMEVLDGLVREGLARQENIRLSDTDGTRMPPAEIESYRLTDEGVRAMSPSS